jgi:hypothetical protein
MPSLRHGLCRLSQYTGQKRTYCKETQSLVIASKEIGLAVRVENTKCRFVCPKQHAGQNHSTN